MDLTGLSPWGGLAGASLEQANVVVAGIAYDGSAVYRKGAALAPAKLRSLSAAIPPVGEDGESLVAISIHDMGDLPAGADIENGWSAVADALASVPPDKVLTVLGGDHCTAIATLAAQARRHPDVAVIWLDAHPDLCDFSRGGRWTCGCALRRALDTSKLAPQSIAMIGGRDFDLEEIEFMNKNLMLQVPTRDVVIDVEGTVDRINEMIDGRPVHISFDVDALDPAFAPGTEIPSAGGLTTRQILDLLDGVGSSNRLVGLDVVELSPPFDHSDITAFAALKVIFEYWGWAVDGIR